MSHQNKTLLTSSYTHWKHLHTHTIVKGAFRWLSTPSSQVTGTHFPKQHFISVLSLASLQFGPPSHISIWLQSHCRTVNILRVKTLCVLAEKLKYEKPTLQFLLVIRLTESSLQWKECSVLWPKTLFQWCWSHFTWTFINVLLVGGWGARTDGRWSAEAIWLYSSQGADSTNSECNRREGIWRERAWPVYVSQSSVWQMKSNGILARKKFFFPQYFLKMQSWSFPSILPSILSSLHWFSPWKRNTTLNHYSYTEDHLHCCRVGGKKAQT